MAPTHSVLMPLKSTREFLPERWVNALVRSRLRACHLFIGVDYDDRLWAESHRALAEAALERANVQFTVVKSPATQPAGAVCAVWDRLARAAVLEHGREGWLVLFGDDVQYETDDLDWLDAAWDRLGGAPTPLLLHPLDLDEPSLCTFPVVHSVHVRRFGSLLPSLFEAANQEADPYLHELYRRAGAVEVLHGVRVRNDVGGAERPGREARPPPRYDRSRPHRAAIDAALDEWTAELRTDNRSGPSTPTVDVVVPSYRCDARVLARIQAAMRKDLDNALLIIQVDDPASPCLDDVLALGAHDTRVRVNATNRGASATRNAGLAESRGEIVIFLDDDVEPSARALVAMRDGLAARRDDCCGAVGVVCFPPSADVLHEATRMSQILTSFEWPAGLFTRNAPWGVTAFLGVWRRHAAPFDVRYAKAGGGEDVAFCLDVWRNSGGLPWAHVLDSVVVHEFWPRGPGLTGAAEYLRHFWKWTQGDGLLLDAYPEHVYVNWPNVVELTALSPVACLAAGVDLVSVLLALWLVEATCESVDALRGPHGRHLPRGRRLAAAALSALVKNVVDAGHLAYWARRGRLDRLGCRFDWFVGVHHGVVRGERRKFAIRALLWSLAACVTTCVKAYTFPQRSR